MVYSKNNNGFTLVELSIVLVIIALVVAGILSGQTMIKNAKLISVYNDITKFTTAFSSFRDSYKALPGDLGDIPGASFNNIGTIRNNGIINWDDVLTSGTNETTESILAWHHLFIAGLNDFNPIFSPSVELSVINENTRNIPASKIQGAGYLILTHDALKIHSIQLGPPSWSGGGAPNGQGPGISGEDSFFLDNKYDDGLPTSGSITGFDGGPITGGRPPTDCVNAGAYQVGPNNKERVCILRFLLPR
jgi:prepilin-type N-terminal cleavage/methylation domain-containing protein